jgi:4-methylaminobutanoate oxidase (formaldehyde-forming)
MLGLMGPNSRALLAKVSGSDFSNESFPFGTSREIEIGYARVRASRITYVGELGWELYIPAEFALHVFDTLVEAGKEYGLRFAGMHAMNSCRTEKGYRHWGHDIVIEDTPLEAGLGFCISWDKPGTFIGKKALLVQRGHGTLTRRLVQFRLEDPQKLLYHEEPIWLNGKIVGSITSGMYGHRLEGSFGMGYVNNPEGVTREWLENSRFEIEVAWEKVPAKASLGPFYDPKNLRIRT